MGENIIIIVGMIVLGAGLGAAIVFFVLSRKKEENPEKDQGFILLNQNIQQIRENVDANMKQFREEFERKFGESNRDLRNEVDKQFDKSQKLIDKVHEQLVDVTKEVTGVKESSKQFLTVADQLKDLEKTFKHQKQRGNWGEASLKLALENSLTQNDFEMQHTFSDGETVDAIIKTPEGIIPVDAKFSLDNYQRYVNTDDETAKEILEKEFKKDLQKRIDETSKYIRPKEGTLPFAIMYIPAEGIYYDLLINEIGTTNSRRLIDYAYRDKNVVIASPTTFLAYLQTILHGFRAFKFQESIKEVQKNVDQLQVHLNAYQKSFNDVGKSLNATVNHYDRAQTQYRLIDKDVLKITGNSNGFEKLEIEHPKLEDQTQ